MKKEIHLYKKPRPYILDLQEMPFHVLIPSVLYSIGVPLVSQRDLK